MKKFILYFIAFSMYAQLVGCSADDINTSGYLPLSFGVDVQTRGSSTTESSIQQFGVFCFDTGGVLWSTASATATPNKLFNRLVERIENKWVYTPAIEWGGGAESRYTFFGYSPCANGIISENNTTGNNIALVTTATTTGVPIIDFETIPDVINQHDLLVASPHYDLRPSPQPVRMVFDHALTRVGFKAYSAAVGTFIESIEIVGVRYKGNVTLTKPQVWTTDADTTSFTIDFGGGVPVRGSVDKPIDISAPGNYLMTVPQDLSGNTAAKIIFRYRQGVTLDLVKEYVIKENWAISNGTVYVIDLGGSPNSDVIVDRIEIEDWKLEAGGDFEI